MSPSALRPDSTVGGAQTSSGDRSLKAGVFKTSRIVGFEERLAVLRGAEWDLVDRSLAPRTMSAFRGMHAAPPRLAVSPSLATDLDFEALYISLAVL